MRYLSRWPFLAAAVLAFVAAIYLLTETDEGRESGAIGLLVAGSIMLGAFIVLMVAREDD